MKLFLLSVCLVCMIGCGKGGDRQSGRTMTYPALNESPPPPLPVSISLDDGSAEEPEPSILPDTRTGESWIEKHARKEALIQSLRDQAARAQPGDPHALTEEEIDELAKVENLTIE